MNSCVASASAQTVQAASGSAGPHEATSDQPTNATTGTLLTPEALANLLPTTVYFKGKTASLQLRNAGAARFSDGALLWVALVDTSGYASDVQEKYQFYLVTESALVVGGVSLAAGAYGGGFVGDRFLLMDLGGHTVAEGPLQTDPTLRRPRPLQMLPDTPNSVKLYLGRHWVQLHSVASRER